MSKPGEFVELHETAKATLYGTRAEDNNTAEQEYAAALYVCHHAPDDGYELLLALGSVGPRFQVGPPQPPQPEEGEAVTGEHLPRPDDVGEAVIQRHDDGTHTVVRADDRILVTRQLLEGPLLLPWVWVDDVLTLDTAGEYRYRRARQHDAHSDVFERIKEGRSV